MPCSNRSKVTGIGGGLDPCFEAHSKSTPMETGGQSDCYSMLIKDLKYLSGQTNFGYVIQRSCVR